MKTFIIFIIFSTSFFLNSQSNVFEKVAYSFDFQKDNIKLFSYMGDKPYYKAETILDDINAEDIIKNITDFENYPQIFKKTIKFEVTGRENELYKIHAVLNFNPIKNRDYYIKMRVEKTKDTAFIEWFTDESEHQIQPEYRRVKFNYGRWTIKSIDKNKTYISIEYHNDWEIDKVPKNFLTMLEKNETMNSIRELTSYLRSK